ncbi:MAG TPA: C40 family peptidase [Acidothermaceae bacterium]|jgi:cell wall-associated NlpC family hydrolase
MRTALVVVSAATVATVVPAGAAHADPAVSAATAQEQLQALTDKAEILVEKYDAVQDQLATAQRRLTAQHDAVASAQRTVDSSRALVDGIAAGAYESGGVGGMQAVLFSNDPQRAMQSADILQRIAADRGRVLASATAARNNLAQAQTSAAQAVAGVQALQASLTVQQHAIDALVGTQQAAVKVADQAVAVHAAAAAQVARAQTRVALTKAATKAAPKAAAPAPARAVTPAALPVGLDGRAAAAVQYAYAQLGKPYRYGASGASTFDCSGLTMQAWAAAGVALGHNAAGQYASTRHVSRDALQPGDLVYFGRPIHHDGIYIGGGKFIEAPYTGATIRISELSNRHDFAGASRP